MAGSTMGESENPVAINVVPMVDVIFCLCVFFMCSFKFKQLEGQFDSWLPKGKGTEGMDASLQLIEEVRIALFWDKSEQRTIRKLRTREIAEDDELQRLIKEGHDAFKAMGKPDTPVIIDAEAAVPWKEVVKVINLCKREEIKNIEFALGAAAPGPKK